MEAYELGTFRVEVKIQELIIKRFRGFEGELSISFDENLTVLIGVNGSGKSTILDAAAGLLDDIACILKGGDYNPGNFFNFFDVNNNQGVLGNAEIEIGLEASFPYKEELFNDGIHIGENWDVKNHPYRVGINLTRRKHRSAEFRSYYNETGTQHPMRNSLRNHLLEWINKSNDPSFDHATSMELPVLAYYPIRRLDEEAKSDARQIDTSIFSNYENQELASGSFHFPTLKTWLGLQYLIKTLPQKQQNNDIHVRKVFDTIIQAIKQFLNESGEETFPHILFEWSEDFPNGEMVIQKGNTSLYYQQLSTGEQVLLSLVADLARQLAIANPRREDPLHGSGVALIDEIDLHLHPGWQRKVLGKLREVFPNLQLVVTTHSPLVLSSIKRSQGRLVRNFQVSNTGPIEGRDASAILEDEFGEEERPKEYQEKLDRFYRLLNTNRDDAELLLEELKQIWGGDDDEIIRAESYLNIF